eukprot:1291258-Rhodomonas_salina.1
MQNDLQKHPYTEEDYQKKLQKYMEEEMDRSVPVELGGGRRRKRLRSDAKTLLADKQPRLDQELRKLHDSASVSDKLGSRRYILVALRFVEALYTKGEGDCNLRRAFGHLTKENRADGAANVEEVVDLTGEDDEPIDVEQMILDFVRPSTRLPPVKIEKDAEVGGQDGANHQ